MKQSKKMLFFASLNFFAFSFLDIVYGTVPPDAESEKFINNFKAVAMHFAEPFLKEARVKELKMEGFDPSKITPIP